MTTPPEVVERLLVLALEHPAYGCNRLEALLALEGRRVSAITIQKILNDHDLGTREQRWLALETRTVSDPTSATATRAADRGKRSTCSSDKKLKRADQRCRTRRGGQA